MDILAAIKREERKLEKELDKLNRKLSGVRAQTCMRKTASLP